MAWQRFEVTQEKGVASVWLNRPEKLNAMDTRMISEFRAILADLRDDERVRVVLLSGRGRAFCAGRDLREKQDSSILTRLNTSMRGTWGEDLYRFSKPVIAAINGACLGAGLDIALFSDIRLASREAVLGYPEVNYGMVVGTGGIQVLSRLVGIGEAGAMVLTGNAISADKAKSIGLVTSVTEPSMLLAEASAIAGTLVEKPPRALLFTKQILRQGQELSHEASVRHDAFIQALLRTAPEDQEALATFREKTSPGNAKPDVGQGRKRNIRSKRGLSHEEE